MATEPRLRPNVQRLLRGDVRSADLLKLFLFARDNCGDREAVREIGHFAAHQDRDKGLVTEYMRDWAVVSAFTYLHKLRAPLQTNALPALFPEFLKASLKRTSDTQLTDSLGLDRKTTRQLLVRHEGRLQRNDDGTWKLDSQPTPAEGLVVNHFLSRAAGNPTVIRADALVDELRSVLLETDLLYANEFEAFNRKSRHLLLFAASLMHNTHIKLNNSETSRIYISDVAISGQSVKVEFSNMIEKRSTLIEKMDDGGGIYSETQFHVPLFVFDTGLSREDSISAALRGKFGGWKFDLELDSDGLLTPVH